MESQDVGGPIPTVVDDRLVATPLDCASSTSFTTVSPTFDDRKLRTLRKRLEQIEALKERHSRGDKLEANQVCFDWGVGVKLSAFRLLHMLRTTNKLYVRLSVTEVECAKTLQGRPIVCIEVKDDCGSFVKMKRIYFLPLDEALASRAVLVIVSGLGGNAFGAS